MTVRTWKSWDWKSLERLYAEKAIRPLLCVAIHAGPQRKMEYGVASQPDYLGRGAKAGFYTSFIIRELIPCIHYKFGVTSFSERAFAGFSLGALMALDIVWNHPESIFKGRAILRIILVAQY